MARGTQRSTPHSPQPPPSTHQLGTRQSSRIAQRQQATVQNKERPSRPATDTTASNPGSPSYQDVPEHEEDSPAETPTRVGSQESSFTLPDISSPAAAAAAATSADSPRQQAQAKEILPLVERVPSIETVVNFLKGSHRIKGILSNPNLFKSEDDVTSFTEGYFAYSKGEDIPEQDSDEWFWEDAWEFMFDSMCEHIPTARKDLKKCRLRYFQDGVHLVQTHFRTRLQEEYLCETPERQRQLRNTSGLIGEVFVEAFEQLTAPPKGKKILLICQQLDKLLDHLSAANLEDLFEDGIDKIVYYVAGFLCRAGEKEADRRSKDTKSPGYLVGQCIREVASNFVSERSPSEVAKVKESLPAEVADLVDKWSVYGGLKYPTRQLYALVAKIEYCFLNLATPQNLHTFGGILISYICTEITSNEILFGHFASLLREDQFEDTTIMAAFKYYVKVYCNLRTKDLSRKFNAALHKSTTAALRPSLATKGAKSKKSKRSKAKSKSRVKPRPKNDATEEHEQTDEQIHNELIDIAGESIEEDDDE